MNQSNAMLYKVRDFVNANILKSLNQYITWIIHHACINHHACIIVGKGFLTLLIYEEPPILLIPHFFNFFQPPAPPFFPRYLLPCFFLWMCDCATLNVLFYFTIRQTYTCWALVSQYQRHLVVCFRKQGINNFTVGLTHRTWLLLALIWYHTHKHIYTSHRGTNWPAYIYKYILTSTVMRSQQLPVLHWMNDSLISKIYFTEVPNIFAFRKLLTSRSPTSAA